jgi:hypothetical protein
MALAGFRQWRGTTGFAQVASECALSFPRDAIELSIAVRFEREVQRNPDRLAGRTSAGELTYAALNRHANQIARAILAQTGDRWEPVALLLPHDALLVAAILGVLKAGKAYVPLDPTYPPGRNPSVLEDSQAALLVINTANAALAKEWGGRSVALLDVAAEPSRHPTEDLGLSILPDAVASSRKRCRNIWIPRASSSWRPCPSPPAARWIDARFRRRRRLDRRVPYPSQAVKLANRQASRLYQPRVYPGKVTLFRASHRETVGSDARLGWGELAAGGLEIHEVPGDHFSFWQEPNVRVLAERLTACLYRALPRSP